MFLKFRRKLINWLAGEDVIVIMNSRVYDYVLEANLTRGKSCLFRRNRVSNLEHQINKEVNHRVDLARQGVRKHGKGFALDPSLL